MNELLLQACYDWETQMKLNNQKLIENNKNILTNHEPWMMYNFMLIVNIVYNAS